MGKLIAKTALITFLVIVALIGAVVGMFIWLAPNEMAQTFESMGLDSLSISMYERAYKKDKSINSLHLLVSKAIAFDADKVLTKYYPKLESHKDYNKFIEALDEANYNADADVLLNIKLSNEDNRLKTRYVSALAKTDFVAAFEYAAADLERVDAAGEKINFCIVGLAKYIDEYNIDMFTNLEKGPVCKKIEDLYLELKDRYEASVASNYDKAIMSGKLVDMIQFMLLVDGKTQDSGYDRTTLTNDLATIFAEYKQYLN